MANAPHVPVHLGSMSGSIKSIIRQNPNMKKGDVFVLNAPFNGGTHLPDVTVITPVFDNGGAILFLLRHGDIMLTSVENAWISSSRQSNY